MKTRAVARALAAELWFNLRCKPWLLVPHPHVPRRGAGDGWRCALCGSRSARVQYKGRAQAEILRRRLS